MSSASSGTSRCLAVHGPGYFKEFYLAGAETAALRMTLAGELVVCFGGLAGGTLYLVTRRAGPP